MTLLWETVLIGIKNFYKKVSKPPLPLLVFSFSHLLFFLQISSPFLLMYILSIGASLVLKNVHSNPTYSDKIKISCSFPTICDHLNILNKRFRLFVLFVLIHVIRALIHAIRNFWKYDSSYLKNIAEHLVWNYFISSFNSGAFNSLHSIVINRKVLSLRVANKKSKYELRELRSDWAKSFLFP